MRPAFGENVSADSGAVVPVNTSFLFPDPNEPSTGLMHATFTQFLSPKFGLVAGKIFTLDSGAGEFAGNYRTQFLNTGLGFPMSFALVPISAYGGGLVVLPWEGVVLSALVLDPSGTAMNNDVTDAFDDGVMVVASAQVAITPFGLRGTQRAGVMWSNKERLSLIQDPTNLGRFLATERFPRLGDPGPIFGGSSSGSSRSCSCPSSPPTGRTARGRCSTASTSTSGTPGAIARAASGSSSSSARLTASQPGQVQLQHGDRRQGRRPGRPRDTFGIGWARTEFSGSLPSPAPAAPARPRA